MVHTRAQRRAQAAAGKARPAKSNRRSLESQALSVAVHMFQRASVAAAAYKHPHRTKRAYHIRNPRISRGTRHAAVGAVGGHYHHSTSNLVQVDMKRPYGKKKRSSERAFFVFPLSGRGKIIKVKNPHGPKDAAIMAKLLASGSTSADKRFVVMRRARRAGKSYAKMDIVELRLIGIHDSVFRHRNYSVRRIGSVSGKNMLPVSIYDFEQLFKDRHGRFEKLVYNMNNGKMFLDGSHVAGTGRPRKQRSRKHKVAAEAGERKKRKDAGVKRGPRRK